MMVKVSKTLQAILMCSIFFAINLTLYSQQHQKMLIRIKPGQESDLKKLNDLDLDYATEGISDSIDVIVDENQLEMIKNRGFQYDLLPAINKANLYDPEYHTYEEMKQELDSLHQVYPDITSIHQIGESQKYRIPIWAIKISDHADTDEDEFTVLYDGLHHAREPIGLASCMVLINHLLSNYGNDPNITAMVDNIEIWIIPIINTEGYKYLVDNDLSSPWWRKNQRDNNQNNRFDPDIDGVDLNRNYDYKFASGGSSDFGSWVYRGPYAFSESEIAAKRDLALRERFLCSLSYHSYGEVIYYMRGLENSTLPETPLLDGFARAVASRIKRLTKAGTYSYSGDLSSANMSYAWMFAVAGSYEVLIETCTEFIPSGRIGLQVANDNLPGAMYLLEKTMAGPGIVGHVRDAITGKFIEAEVKIIEYDRASMTPRKSEAKYGRFHRFAAAGTYTLEVRAIGYKTKTISNVIVGQTGWTEVEIPLEWGPLVAFDTLIIDDDATGLSKGNGDGIANINETIELSVRLKNNGGDLAENVSATLKSLHQYAWAKSESQVFGDIAADSTSGVFGKFLIGIDYHCPDQFQVPFRLQIAASNGYAWEDEFFITVAAPVLEYVKTIIHDSLGNNNGALEPGETVDMEVVVANKGHMDANLDFARLASSSGYIKFLSQMDSSKIIYSGQEESVVFKLSLLATAPEPYITTFSLYFVTLEKYVKTHSFRLTCLAGFFDNMEYGENGWSHHIQGNPENKNDDWQWGRPFGSATGQDPGAAYSGYNCWGNDLGGPGLDGYYENNMNINLKTPMINCSRYSKVGLKFMRWLSVCAGDVAKIFVNDQEVWNSPVAGLYDTQWTEQIIDISAIADGNPNVIISFGLTTNSADVAGGWNIDDLMVKNQLMSSVKTVTEQKIPDDFIVIQNYPNPFNSSTIIRYQLATDGNVVLKIVNVLGQEVRRLVDQKQSAGNQSISWDGKDWVGSDVTSGVYLVSIEIKADRSAILRSKMRKILLIR